MRIINGYIVDYIKIIWGLSRVGKADKNGKGKEATI